MNKLKIISGILKVIKWFFIGIGAVALIVMAFIKDEPIIVDSPPITIVDEQLQIKLDETINSYDDMKLSVDGISAEMPLTWQLRSLKLFAIIVVFAYILWFLQIILNIVQDVRNHNAFSNLNIVRLKRAAWLLILSPIFSSLLHLIFLLVIGYTYELPEGLTFNWVEDIDYDFMVIGFLLYAIAIAFAEGLKMKQENELTV